MWAVLFGSVGRYGLSKRCILIWPSIAFHPPVNCPKDCQIWIITAGKSDTACTRTVRNDNNASEPTAINFHDPAPNDTETSTNSANLRTNLAECTHRP